MLFRRKDGTKSNRCGKSKLWQWWKTTAASAIAFWVWKSLLWNFEPFRGYTGVKGMKGALQAVLGGNSIFCFRLDLSSFFLLLVCALSTPSRGTLVVPYCDIARLSQRYPPIARCGVFGVSTWPIGCDTPSPYSERFPLGEHEKWRCDTPPPKKRERERESMRENLGTPTRTITWKLTITRLDSRPWRGNGTSNDYTQASPLHARNCWELIFGFQVGVLACSIICQKFWGI